MFFVGSLETSSQTSLKIKSTAACFLLFTGLCLANVSRALFELALHCAVPMLCSHPGEVNSALMFGWS